ncbi:uncharacterized protein LOC118418926 [Branchiostoma floridae]|uniref:Uncharacterized protein LOC118418926 n=1 Tax=Branchiostoma floridae TaxID=7739 RepID=A0A9J7LDS0_BRAFL|nr:uncharacterized protein LOC118418926 [Branchiostoma floridae]
MEPEIKDFIGDLKPGGLSRPIDFIVLYADGSQEHYDQVQVLKHELNKVGQADNMLMIVDHDGLGDADIDYPQITGQLHEKVLIITRPSSAWTEGPCLCGGVGVLANWIAGPILCGAALCHCGAGPGHGTAGPGLCATNYKTPGSGLCTLQRTPDVWALGGLAF